ncbi:MAG: PRC and DUF2382 domain-containing protein [Solirubrobacterales bacterium]|nr:PRC and DUF2382 domain-containing protein [Solirubrobacterales bacterium]
MTEAYEWQGRTVVGEDGEKIGTVKDVYVDHQSGKPEWATVSSGLFGMKSHFVPLASATPAGEDVRVPVTKDQVNGAPGVDPDGELSELEEQRLFEHYGVPYTSEGSTTAQGAPRGGYERGAGQGYETRAGGADDAMTRSEEELRVGTAARERGRVRLRKYVVTEHVQQTVPVRREEVRLEREPITDENVDEAMSGPEISEAEHEVVLHEEEPVVEKRAVPKERVRLEKETVTDEAEVSEEVRKERIEPEGDTPPQ